MHFGARHSFGQHFGSHLQLFSPRLPRTGLIPLLALQAVRIAGEAVQIPGDSLRRSAACDISRASQATRLN